MNQTGGSQSFREIGVRWHYWLIAIAFGCMGAFAIYARKLEPESAVTLLVCGVFFVGVSILALIWPILRVYESRSEAIVRMRDPAEGHESVVLRFSTTKVWVSLIGSIWFGTFGFLTILGADENEYRVKGAIAAVLFLCASIFLIRSLRLKRRGIWLSQNGIQWVESPSAQCAIPWEAISEVALIYLNERYARPPGLGVIVKDIDALYLSKARKQKIERTLSQHGVHFACSDEDLLLPLESAALALNFYLSNPDTRQDFRDDTALSRIRLQSF